MNRASEIRAEVAAKYPGAAVIERGLTHIRHQLPNTPEGRKRFAYDGVIGILHYKDDKGKWQEIDDVLVDDGEDGFVVKSEHTKHLLRIAADGRRRLYPDRYDLTRYVEYSALPDVDAHERHGNHLGWDRPHHAAKVTNIYHGVKFDYTLKNAQAPTSISFGIKLVGLARKGRDLLADGTPVLEMPLPTATDAEGTVRGCSLTFKAGRATVSLDTEGLVFPIVVDPTTVDKQVAATADDGATVTTGSVFISTSTANALGSVNTVLYRQWYRFLGVTCAGTINVSYIQLYPDGAKTGTPAWKIRAVDADNHPAPTDYNGFVADVNGATTAGVDWDGGLAEGAFRSSPSLNAIFAELVASYTISNDAIIILGLDDVASGSNYQSIRMWDYAGNAHGAKLHIEYTASVMTPKAVAGTCGALTGTVLRPCTRRRTLSGTMGALTGIVTKSYKRARSMAGTCGALTGAVVQRANKSLKGTAGALTGTVLGRLGKNLTGTIGALTGNVVKKTSKGLVGTVGLLVGAIYLKTVGKVFLSGSVGELTGTLTKQTNKVLSGVAGVLSGTMTRVVPYRRLLTGVLGALTGTLVRQTNKQLSGTIDPTGVLRKLTKRYLSGTMGALTGSLRRLTSKGLAGELTNLVGSIIPSFIWKGAATLLGGGTFIVSGLTFTPVQGGRLYIEIYDALGNKLGSGPIYQVQHMRFTRRLDKGGDFEFEMPAADDRAILIEQGREIRVYREGEGEIYRGLIEKAMWDVS